MNAALQILLRIPGFVQRLEIDPPSMKSNNNNSSEPIRSCVLNIVNIEKRWMKIRRAMSKSTTDLTSLLELERQVARHLSSLKRLIAESASEAIRFSGFRQQDSHEWIGNFLEALDVEMEKRYSSIVSDDKLFAKLPTRFCFHTELVYTLSCKCSRSRARHKT